jgi:rhamnulokinase
VNPAGPSLIAIDLGAASCRVSLLRWQGEQPRIEIVRRFANAPQDHGPVGLRWNLDSICAEIEAALHSCAQLAPDGIAAIGVTGWAVDYVRLDAAGHPLAPPYCYRDARNAAALRAVHAILPAEQLYATTGVQIQPLNTVYQLFADDSGTASAPWVNLPEYILHSLGAPRVAEYTNATHTGLIDAATRQWSDEIFCALHLDRAAAPEIVAPGTVLGPVRPDLRVLPAFAHTQLIAPACHDTASAVAGMGDSPGFWAYISSGTWSLVGTLLPAAVRTPEACARGFTNLGAADGRVLFHRGITGMWPLQQCMESWNTQHAPNLPVGSLEDLIAAARKVPEPDALLDLDDPALAQPGDMPARINAQRTQSGLSPLPERSDAAPQMASLIFHSLAARYAALISEIARLTGRRPERIRIAGGGSRNDYLNALTARAADIPVERCSVESATLGNLALQWVSLDNPHSDASRESLARKLAILNTAEIA